GDRSAEGLRRGRSRGAADVLLAVTRPSPRSGCVGRRRSLDSAARPEQSGAFGPESRWARPTDELLQRSTPSPGISGIPGPPGGRSGGAARDGVAPFGNRVASDRPPALPAGAGAQ